MNGLLFAFGNIREIAVMPVDDQWIPFDGYRDGELVRALVA